MKYVIPAGFLIAAIVNIMPGVGVLSNAWLQTLYGVGPITGDLSLLLRHRAILFLIVGALLLVGAVDENVRTVAGIAGLVSMCSYVVLYWLVSDTGPELRRVLYVDLFGIAALGVAMALHLAKR